MHGLHQVRPRDPTDPIIAKASFPREEGPSRAWARALALFVLALPLYNPDLFWHLSAGRWIWAHGAVPRVDPFSFTQGGQPWIDFEWLFQALVYAVHSASGLWGLRAFKAVLLIAAWTPINRLLKTRGANALARALALAFWSAAVLPQSDLRPDLFSLIFVSVLLNRLDRDAYSWKFSLPFFALWANLHAGFVLGLGLYAAKAASLLIERKRPPRALLFEAAVAVLGTFLNPFGPGLYAVLGLHASHGQDLSRYIQEWGGLSYKMPLQWPLMACLGFFAFGLWERRRSLPLFPALVAVPAALAVLVTSRFGLTFALAGSAALFCADKTPTPRRAHVLLAALTALALWPFSRVPWAQPFADSYVARPALDFVAAQRELDGLRLFNTYEWGGYLGWARPGSPVFGDGRYQFSGQLPELEAAMRTAPDMAAFVERHRLEGLVIKNYPNRLPSTRLYKDGSRREFLRPWHLFLLPRERWALVWFDRQALVFVDRAKVPAAWLAAHEYRWLRPGDEAALTDALARGEVPAAALEAEVARQAAESGKSANARR